MFLLVSKPFVGQTLPDIIKVNYVNSWYANNEIWAHPKIILLQLISTK